LQLQCSAVALRAGERGWLAGRSASTAPAEAFPAQVVCMVPSACSA
jgi:hypothetical protein